MGFGYYLKHAKSTSSCICLLLTGYKHSHNPPVRRGIQLIAMKWCVLICLNQYHNETVVLDWIKICIVMKLNLPYRSKPVS